MHCFFLQQFILILSRISASNNQENDIIIDLVSSGSNANTETDISSFEEDFVNKFPEKYIKTGFLEYDEFELFYKFNYYVYNNNLNYANEIARLEKLSKIRTIFRLGDILTDIIEKIKTFKNQQNNTFVLVLNSFNNPVIDFLKVITEIISLFEKLRVLSKTITDDIIIIILNRLMNTILNKFDAFIFKLNNGLQNVKSEDLANNETCNLSLAFEELKNKNPENCSVIKASFDSFIVNENDNYKIGSNTIDANSTNYSIKFLINVAFLDEKVEFKYYATFEIVKYLKFVQEFFDEIVIIRDYINRTNTYEYNFDQIVQLFDLLNADSAELAHKQVLYELICLQLERLFFLGLIAANECLHRTIQYASSTNFSIIQNIKKVLRKIYLVLNDVDSNTIEYINNKKITNMPFLKISDNFINSKGIAEKIKSENLSIVDFKKRYHNLCSIKESLLNEICEYLALEVYKTSKIPYNSIDIKKVIFYDEHTVNKENILYFLNQCSDIITKEIITRVCNCAVSTLFKGVAEYPLIIKFMSSFK